MATAPTASVALSGVHQLRTDTMSTWRLLTSAHGYFAFEKSHLICELPVHQIWEIRGQGANNFPDHTHG